MAEPTPGPWYIATPQMGFSAITGHPSRLALTGSIRPAPRRHRYGQAVALLEWLAPRTEAFIAGLAVAFVIVGIAL